MSKQHKLILITFFVISGMFSASLASAATQIYRSVGPSATAALATDGSHARTVTVSGGVATFSVGLSADTGVGDAVLIDTGGTDQAIDASDTLLFIHGRTSSTVFAVRTHTGTTPSDITVNDTYSIYRAHTSLSNAEAGTKNTSIPITFNGGNRDLVTNDEQWNITCYANGTTADSTSTVVDGWTTDATRYIKIYTPVSSSEVGTSQRHNGKWDAGKYKIEIATQNTGMLVQDPNIKIEGLQVKTSSVAYTYAYGIWLGLGADAGSEAAYVSNNIIRDGYPDGGTSHIGIMDTSVGGTMRIFNNIIYDFKSSDNMYGFGIQSSAAVAATYIYNNTIYNSRYGMYLQGGTINYVKNNITQNCIDGFFGTPHSSSDYNISDLTSDAPSPSYRSGLATDVTFVDETNKDFHLSQADASARQTGANLTADASLPITTDIDGQLRNPSGVGWDIGADEGTKEFTSSVMQTGGDYSSLSSWETGVQTDLTATTTRVFTHGGITGTIADNSTVTGLTSSATATVVHATTTQILLESISGTFQTGETVQVTAGNSVVISDNGNPASAVAKIDGSWSSADVRVDISSWTTGADNYIKIYTTQTARHQGKWDDTRYRVSHNSWEPNIGAHEEYIQIDGVQFYSYTSGALYPRMISSGVNNKNSLIKLSNNLFKANWSGLIASGSFQGVAIQDTTSYGAYGNMQVYNNVFYNLKSTPGWSAAVYSGGFNFYVYNNTVYNGDSGFIKDGGSMMLKNNLVANTNNPFNGGYATGTDYNATDINDTPGIGSNNKVNQTFNFVSTLSGAEDFHLAQSDTGAKNSGTDLSSDAYLPFSTDLDGITRNTTISQWDIGADEISTQIYRSVGPSATGLLASDSSHANTVTLTSGVATFSAALSDAIGVGDAVIIDTGGTDQSIDASDTILFIQKRNSSTSYQLQANNGSVPGNISVNDTYQIYRAYTSLSNAEAGTKNTSIPITFNGGNRDLVANNEEWNISCYANGTTADTVNTAINGWTTGVQNFIRVYTPTASNEVGISQRHGGKWDDSRYNMVSSNSSVIQLYSAYVKIEGIQMKNTCTTAGTDASIIYTPLNTTNSLLTINANIFFAQVSGINTMYAFNDYYQAVKNVKLSNNIFYDITGGANEDRAVVISGGTFYLYNNTIYNAEAGFKIAYSSTVVAKNNIVQGATDGFYGSFNAASDYNISNLTSDAPSPSYRSGLATTVSFVDATNKDFHLALTDTTAKNSGVDLSSDIYLNFSNDIDGASRNSSINAWDIGADETATQIFRSVGPSATSSLATDSSHANTVTLTSGVATFSAALSDVIGVGDAVIIDTGGTDQSIDASDTILFIQKRNSSTSYQLQANNGSVPGNISVNDTYQIYRAYTSLSNAEAGTKNTSIPITFNGGNRDLVANNEEWNISCYANGTTADGGADILGWMTAQQNFVKIYTPVSLTEVGISQRHNGKRDDSKYHISSSISTGIYVKINNSVVDGIQVFTTGTFRAGMGVLAGKGTALFLNNLINAIDDGGFGSSFNSKTAVFFFNNIIYDSVRGIYHYSNDELSYYYNNTIVNAGICIDGNGGNRPVYKNNITQGCTDGFNSTDASSDYNISDIVNDAPSPSYRSGLATDVVFVDETNKDFHLSQTDTSARQSGTNLTADASLPITTDIDGQLRNPSGVGWDIGADEGTKEFTPTVMQTGGDYSTLSSWETGVQTDLTATTTRVFTHSGITGTIADNSTVTGLTSSATATVVHATTTQILLESISGTFQSGETVQVTSGNNVVISDNGNPASAVAKIDGAWSVADTTAVDINGWISGADNYIKIYTTQTARHQGKWDDMRYQLSPPNNSIPLSIAMGYVRIDGLQIKASANSVSNISAIDKTGKIYNNIYSNNIIRGNYAEGYEGIGIRATSATGTLNVHIFNNIIYGFNVAVRNHSGTKMIVYNNTTYGNITGIYRLYSTLIAKNNIAYNNGTDYYTEGSFDSSSTNNLSSDGSAPGSNPKINTAVSFVSTTSGLEDFHLAPTDTAARDSGADLSADPLFASPPCQGGVSGGCDIDGNIRNASITAWDIGADESATRIFRSVGPSATGLLAADSSHANTVTLTSGTATFSSALADNIGVGDAVIIDTGGTDQTIDSSDTLLFISGRTSSTVYTLKTHTGATPNNISVNDTYQIYRAHTSLNNAESGTANTSLSGLGFSFNGGNRDLVTNNEEWNISCYANGTTADGSSSRILSGWTTGNQNYLKIYTPINASEVGISQRHDGKPDNTKYSIESSIADGIYIQTNYTRVDGIQILTTGGRGLRVVASGGGKSFLSDNLITVPYDFGIFSAFGNSVVVYAWNNIIYNSSVGVYQYAGNPLSYYYNNTVINSGSGFAGSATNSAVLKNNITQNCTDGYVYFDASSDYNISDLAGDAPSPSYRSGLATDVSFINESAYDFHLASTDTMAKNAGVNLSQDPNLRFTTDIDGKVRPTEEAWDIGADETTDAEAVRMKGDIRMKGDVKFK